MKRFSNILLIVDEGTDYSATLKRAVTLARNNQALLTICAIADAIPSEMQMGVIAITPAELLKIAVTEKREWLEKAVKSVAAEGVALKVKVLIGKPFIEIIRQVLGNDYDLIIKCAEVAGGLRDMLFGSTDMHLMRKCPCPVWIIKPTERHKYHRILAAVDKDPEEPVKDVLNRQILEMSTSLALAEFSEPHIVHAWSSLGEDFFRSPRSGVSHAEVDAMVEEEASARRRWLENLVNTYGSNADKNAIDILKPQLHVIKGRAKHVVPAKASELAVDLVVMGTVARTGIDGFFMGNTAESILTQLDCSVLTVKPPGFISPVTVDG
jgi:nucleotide-binding universal stress UspA family protein